ncbi:nitrogen regulatory protein P-II [Peptococcaceae bacterium CEB3]|nr:nitrogen regulatory protein P-II [Peptococcaceae bacterium CEB3]
MKKIEAIIRPGKLEELKEELSRAGLEGITVSSVLGHGRQKGHAQIYRGQEVLPQLLPKVKIEIVTVDAKVPLILDLIQRVARTGSVGDGKIFVIPVEEVIRIRTGDRGENGI